MVFRMTIDPMERFVDSIDVLPNGCWQWNKKLDSKGYSMFTISNQEFRMSGHRFAYFLFKGNLIKGMHLDHLCRNPGCVNPDHLEQVTPKENFLRGVGIAAINTKKTTCPRGHHYDYDIPKGGRWCKTCLKEARDKHRNRLIVPGKT
jgi:hypothetical protein